MLDQKFKALRDIERDISEKRYQSSILRDELLKTICNEFGLTSIDQDPVSGVGVDVWNKGLRLSYVLEDDMVCHQIKLRLQQLTGYELEEIQVGL